MYYNDASIREVNAYYARREGIRTANIRNYANIGCFSSLMQQAVAQAGPVARKDQTPAPANGSAAPASTGHSQAHATDSGNICCEQCHSVNQLMLQMLSQSLYSQNALNYPLSGYGTWMAYRNMADMADTNLS